MPATRKARWDPSSVETDQLVRRRPFRQIIQWPKVLALAKNRLQPDYLLLVFRRMMSRETVGPATQAITAPIPSAPFPWLLSERRRWSRPVGGLLFALGLSGVMAFLHAGQALAAAPANVGVAVASARSLAQAAPLNPVGLAAADRQGALVSTSPDPVAQELAERMRAAWAALDQLDAGPATRLPPVPTEGHPKPWLVPPPAQFSEEQLRVLAALRWRSGKQLQVRGNANNRTLRFLEGLSLEAPAEQSLSGWSLAETTAQNFLRRNRELLLLKDPAAELHRRQEGRDKLGYTQLAYAQKYEGLEVWPAGLTVQLDRAGHVQLVTGAYAPTPEGLDLVPRVDEAGALEAARRTLGLSPEAPIEECELIVYAPVEGAVRLAYRVELHTTPLEHWLVVVDALSGVVLESINQVCTAATVGSGTDLRGQTRPLNLWTEDNRHYLVDAGKPMFNAGLSDPPSPGTTFGGIIILDAKGVDPSVNPGAYAPELISSLSTTSGFPAEGVSASYNLSLVHDYFLDRHARNSINGQGGTIIGVVNVPVDNAFWHQGVITLGSGDRWADSLDFVGHEMAHGVTERSAGLIYRDQSGALNEAFSDLLGEAAEAYHRGQTDWRLGSQMSRQLRDMRDPESFEIVSGRPFPARMSQFITAGDPLLDRFPGRDNGGVHFNSSIINHAFYQLAEGLPDAIGIRRAEQIFYRALTTKLQQQSQFIDCRLACVQAAVEIFGPGSTEAIQTGEAFNLVEIFDQAPTSEPTPILGVGGQDSIVFTFVDALTGLTFLARREAALGDPASGVILSPGVAMAPRKRPSVLGDGSRVMVVTLNNDLALVDTLTGEGTSLGLVGQVWSAGLSVDGRFAAIILRDTFGQPQNRIHVIELGTQQLEAYELLAPTIDGGSIGTVLYGDTLDFSLDGGLLYYDALNRLRFSDGSVFDNWSLYVIERNTARVFEVVPPIPGLNIGNPSIGQIHNHRLVFEAQNPAALTSTLYGLDTVSGRSGALFTVNSAIDVGYPHLNGDDTVLYFTDYFFDGPFFTQAILGAIPLTPDGLSFSGNANPTLTGNAAGPLIGAVYRRGTYAGLPVLEVNATVPATSPDGSPPGLFTLARTGSTAAALPVSYVLTGTARNGTDFFGVALNATIAAGASSTTVSILPFDTTPMAAEETVILTLSPASHYLIGDSDSARVTIVRGDPPDNAFREWALANGVVGEQVDPDADGYNNFLEFALGTDPKVADPPGLIHGGLLSVDQQSYLSFTVNRLTNNPAVQYRIEVADEMTGPWSSGPPQIIVLEDTPTRLVVRDANAVATRARRFMRLQLALP